MSILLLAGLVAAPSFAARDAAQMIAQDKANQAAIQRRADPASGVSHVQPLRVVLPLDHGPRAVTTPALNQQRLEKFAQAATPASASQR